MKLRSSYFALLLLLSCTVPCTTIYSTQDQEYRSRSGAVIEATSLGHLQSIIAKNANVVVDFYASWCRPCQKMLPEFSKLADTMKNIDIVFVKVNVDIAGSNYGIRMLPTFVCFSNNNEISRSSGFKPLNDISNYIKSVYPYLF